MIIQGYEIQIIGVRMKRTILMAFTASQILTQAQAGGDIAPVIEPEVVVEKHTESDFYVVVKGMRIAGDTAAHEDALLDGDVGYGFGIDVGYRLGNGFALEYDFSYAKNTVTETIEDISEEGTAKYYTHALDLVYTYELTETVRITSYNVCYTKLLRPIKVIDEFIRSSPYIDFETAQTIIHNGL